MLKRRDSGFAKADAIENGTFVDIQILQNATSSEVN
jgi:hypothetical protein